MGNMSEEMKKVMAKWGTEEQPAQAASETPAKRVTYRSQIYELVKATPGITSVQVFEELRKRSVPQTYNSVSSQLTSLSQDFKVRREVAARPEGGKPVLMFYAVPPVEAIKLKAEHTRKLAQARLRAERARQAKAEKLKQKHATSAAQRPQEQLALPFNTPADVAATPAAPDLRSMSAMDILSAINLPQAKELYKALKEAFGD